MNRSGAATLSSFLNPTSTITKKACSNWIEKHDEELISHEFEHDECFNVWDCIADFFENSLNAKYFIIDEPIHIDQDSLDYLILNILKICKLDVIIYDIKENIYLNSDTRYSSIVMYCSRSAIKSEKRIVKSNTTSKVWQERIERINKGEKPLLNCPQWIDYDESLKDYKLNERAIIIRDIFNRIVNGSTMNKIAVDLNSNKIATIGSGKAWSVGSISWILKNKSSMGTLCIKDREFENFFPAAVSKDIFLFAANELKRRSQRRSVISGNTNANLVTGIAECGECGSPMHLQGSFRKSASGGTNDYRYLICSAQRANKGACDCKPFRYEFFEVALSIILANSEFLDISTSESDSKKMLESSIEYNKQKLDDLKSRLIKLVDALSIVESAEITDKIKKLDGDRDDLIKLIEDDEQSLHSMNIFEPKMTLHEKMKLMSVRLNVEHSRAGIIALLGRILSKCEFYSDGVVKLIVADNEIKINQSGKGINVILPSKTINFKRK